MAKNVVKINESQLRRMITEGIEEALGYDMSTPEGRQGAEKWMRYIISQEDPAETRAKEYAYENGFDGDENIINAFISGVEYGRELNQKKTFLDEGERIPVNGIKNFQRKFDEYRRRIFKIYSGFQVQ